MKRREAFDRPTVRTATWAAAAAALLGAAALAVRRSHHATVRALVGVRHDEASGRGRATTPPSPAAREAGHEMRDMRGGLMGKLVVLLGSVALCMVLAMAGLRIWIVTAQRDGRPAYTREQTAVITPPTPHLQRDPLGEIAALHRGEDKLLDTYGYLDEERTRARIPIDRAMALTVGQPLAPPP